MFKNYLKIAFRNILGKKEHSFANIIGLSLGMLVAFIVFFLIVHETSYDRYQKDADRTFILYSHPEGTDYYSAYTSLVLAATLKDKYPEIESIAQVRALGEELNLIKGNDYYKLDNGFLADVEICKILSFNFISGDVNSYFKKPNAVLISQNMLEKYFGGNKNIIGNTIKIKHYQADYFAEITGIFQNVPENSQFRPEMVLNTQLYTNKNKDILSNWGYNNFITYIHLKSNVNKQDLLNKINSLLNASITEATGNNTKIEYCFLPLTDAHLHSAGISGIFGKKGSVHKNYVYLSIGLLTLLIGCINFININTAKSSVRAKEIGVRKVVGASRQGIVLQLLTESLMVSLFSLPITLMLFELSAPYLSAYFDRPFKINYCHDWQYLVGLIVMVLFVGIFSGFNSALITSKHMPVDILKGQSRIKSSKSYFRRILISVQFIVFSGMLVCSLVIYNQMKFLKDADIGYNKNNLVALLIPSGINNSQGESFVNELRQIPSIANASITSSIPPSLGNRLTRGMKSISKPNQEVVQYQMIECDENYKSVLGLKIKEGNFFEKTTATTRGIVHAVINETAEKELGLKHPIGEILNFNGHKIQIIGIVKDFNYNALYDPITPLVFLPTKTMLAGVVIKLSNVNITATMDAIRIRWNAFFPNSPFTFKFVDEELDKLYRKDQLFGTLITCFAIIATSIAVIGLAGLVAFTTSRRFKEIGIRKVLGASAYKILLLLTTEIFVIFFVACLISFPITYYLMTGWLETFVYRTKITFDVFAIVFVTTLVIALLAVGFQSIKAAMANPIKTLRYE